MKGTVKWFDAKKGLRFHQQKKTEKTFLFTSALFRLMGLKHSRKATK